jgi:hypothetical protein
MFPALLSVPTVDENVGDPDHGLMTSALEPKHGPGGAQRSEITMMAGGPDKVKKTEPEMRSHGQGTLEAKVDRNWRDHARNVF